MRKYSFLLILSPVRKMNSVISMNHLSRKSKQIMGIWCLEISPKWTVGRKFSWFEGQANTQRRAEIELRWGKEHEGARTSVPQHSYHITICLDQDWACCSPLWWSSKHHKFSSCAHIWTEPTCLKILMRE